VFALANDGEPSVIFEIVATAADYNREARISCGVIEQRKDKVFRCSLTAGDLAYRVQLIDNQHSACSRRQHRDSSARRLLNAENAVAEFVRRCAVE